MTQVFFAIRYNIVDCIRDYIQC